MNSVEEKIQALIERNRRVEIDKAWETSFTRRVFIAVVTYSAAALLFWSAGLPTPLLQALIPSAAYFISTLSLPWVKRWWSRF
ncbi:hypothetical protein HYW84_04280 [Candidatus Peregrinibacteria bacterium]|nr:hypothetical protein [Candidatus Peregrinibacteria bacterium]